MKRKGGYGEARGREAVGVSGYHPGRLQVYLFILSLCLVGIPSQAWSAKASLLIHPTLITFSGKARSQEVMIVNRGDATGIFEIGWVDFSMTPEGGLQTWDKPAPWSLQPHVRYSPRRATLRPGETQVIKIALRRRQGIGEGEYMSHLKVLLINENVDAGADRADQEPAGVVVKARTSMTIPVVWHNTSAVAEAVIHSASLNPERHEISVEVGRLGAVSVRGYLHTFHRKADGHRVPIADPLPLVIYQNLDKRTVSIPLTIGAAESLVSNGVVEIVYSQDLEDPSSAIVSYQIEF